MSIVPYIKEIGRGKEGARSLSAADACDLMSQVLDGTVSHAQRGAFALAMRIKGESAEELAGFLQATQARMLPLPGLPPVPVWLPSYNGARKLPNLTPLLALLLAQEGVPVLVHGPRSDPGRVCSFEIFQALGLPVAQDVEDLLAGWRRHEPVFMPTERLCPPLASLLALRAELGLRNSGHTVAKLLHPPGAQATLRVVNHTHPEYGQSLGEFLRDSQAHAMLLRGTEGEPVADARRAPRMALFLAGVEHPELGVPAQEGVLAQLPMLPRANEALSAVATAEFIQAAASGAKPVPAPLLAQVAALQRARERLLAPPQPLRALGGAGA